MADGQPVVRPQAERGPDPDEISRRTFATSFRGYDQQEVRGFLMRMASDVRSLIERERDARNRLEAIEARPAPRQPDEEQLLATLGQEAARVLHAAKEAAADIRTKAEEHVARLVREAQEEAARVRSEAEQLLELRTAEAEQAAEAIRAEAAQEAEGEVELARSRGKEMLTEAQAVRERILRDLARRRRLAHQQIEQLRAGRDRLLEAYRVVRQTLDEATGELTKAEAEARAAAEAAAMRTSADAEATVEELEAELAAARDAALPLIQPEGASAPVEDTVVEEPPAADVATDAVPTEEATEPEAEPEPEPEVEAKPEVAAGPPPAEERRSSSLRLLRRRRESAGEETAAAHAGAVDVGDEVEGVRVLRVVEDETAAEEAPAEPAGGEDPEEEPPHTDVDELFARIKADREAAVAKAEEVLAEVGEADDSSVGDVVAAAEVAEEKAVADTAAEGEVPSGDEPGEDAGGPVDHQRDLLGKRDEAVRPLERSAAKAVKRVLTDEQNEVLDRLRRHRGKPGSADLLPEEKAHAVRYAEAVSKELSQAASAGAEFVGGSNGTSVGDLAAGLAAEITSGLRERVERCIGEANGSEEGDGLSERISAAYREWKSQRAGPLVQDAVVAAFSKGAYQAVPDGVSMRWIVDFGGKGCPDGDDNALAGLTVKGQRFPTGQCHPPAHAGCRCLLVPEKF